VLGLGKLGGEDLNWSSDIDLVLVHRGDGMTPGGTTGSVPTVTYYTRLAEALARAMSTVTEDGFCFRVDLDLRPQGRAGAAVSSLPAMLQYYEQQGRTWSGRRGSRPAPWPATSRWDRSCSRDSDRSSGGGRSTWPRSRRSGISRCRSTCAAPRGESDVKLGPGGIREVEVRRGGAAAAPRRAESSAPRPFHPARAAPPGGGGDCSVRPTPIDCWRPTPSLGGWRTGCRWWTSGRPRPCLRPGRSGDRLAHSLGFARRGGVRGGARPASDLRGAGVPRPPRAGGSR
jgi:hypothetical protein